MENERVIFYTGSTSKMSREFLHQKDLARVDFATEFLSAAIQILENREPLEGPYEYKEFNAIFNFHTIILLDVWQIDTERASTMKFFLFLIKEFLQAEEHHRIIFVSEGNLDENTKWLLEELQEFRPEVIEVK